MLTASTTKTPINSYEHYKLIGTIGIDESYKFPNDSKEIYQLFDQLTEKTELNENNSTFILKIKYGSEELIFNFHHRNFIYIIPLIKKVSRSPQCLKLNLNECHPSIELDYNKEYLKIKEDSDSIAAYKVFHNVYTRGLILNHIIESSTFWTADRLNLINTNIQSLLINCQNLIDDFKNQNILNDGFDQPYIEIISTFINDGFEYIGKDYRSNEDDSTFYNKGLSIIDEMFNLFFSSHRYQAYAEECKKFSKKYRKYCFKHYYV